MSLQPNHPINENLLINTRLLLPDRITPGAIRITDGKIAAVYPETQPSVPRVRRVFDLQGCYLSPGLTDIHIHGSAGIDVLDASPDDFRKLSDFLLRSGVTSYFPTLVPVDDAAYVRAIESIKAASLQHKSTARIRGIHFEGPFVNKSRCGALHPDQFRTYNGNTDSIEVFLGLQTNETESKVEDSGSAFATLMTLAPEVEGGLELIRELNRHQAKAFIGHTSAGIGTLEAAFDAGAHHITHLPNALDPMHHRNPGAAGWALSRRDVTVDCIADFHHVHPLMLKVLFQNKGHDGMSLISDAIPPTGLPDGVYEVWNDRIQVVNGRTALLGRSGANDNLIQLIENTERGDGAELPTSTAANPHPAKERGSNSGTIAGSVITLLQAVRNMVSLGVPLNQAVTMASLSPARAAGIDASVGSIEIGKCADLIVLNDQLEVVMVFVGGELYFDAR